MAKFPTEVESAVTTVKAPIEKAYKYLWDVVGSSACIPGLKSCKKVGPNTYQFVYEERSDRGHRHRRAVHRGLQGRRQGFDHLVGAPAKGDNTDVDGEIRLEKAGAGTKITLRQMVAPDTPVLSLLQRLVCSFAEKEASASVKAYLAQVKKTLEAKA
ncbi:MAG: hypothetical protein U0802_19460 [Candidatus Binatia bacterium]